MNQDPGWAKRVAVGVGKRVAHYRGKTSAQQLADRCKELGMPALSRIVITRLENGRRDAVSVAEVSILAEALGVPPVLLLFPIGNSGAVEMLPGQQEDPWAAYQWFIGRADLAWPGTQPQMGESNPIVLWGEHLRIEASIEAMDDYRRASAIHPADRPDGPRPPLVTPGIFVDNIEVLTSSLLRIRQRMREAGMTPPPLQPETIRIIGKDARDTVVAAIATSDPAMQPVVAAIVTSDRGVLIGRRNDGRPPWTFIAGEEEPGELAADTAIREVKEETGLRIQVRGLIGERVHPKTGRTMIYMAAVPTHGTDVFVGDEDELAEVRWVGLAEADELLPGMYEPVRDHLVRTLGRGTDGPR
jgi:8-oxo-dGTP pyrophosphatase MutT (NUDIX family)/transcriptional regulator with XRE-family HTH domain